MALTPYSLPVVTGGDGKKRARKDQHESALNAIFDEIDERFDDNEAIISSVSGEVINARGGKANLDARLDEGEAATAAVATGLTNEVKARSALVDTIDEADAIILMTALRQVIGRFGANGEVVTRFLSILSSGGNELSLANAMRQFGVSLSPDGLSLGGALRITNGESAEAGELVGLDVSSQAVRVAAAPGYKPPVAGTVRRVGRRLEVYDLNALRPDGVGNTSYVNLSPVPAQVVVAAGQPAYTPKGAQMLPGVAVSGSRIWAAWSRNPSVESGAEENGNFVVVAFSDDGGTSWTEAFYVLPVALSTSVANDPQMWVDPDGKLWVFYAQHATSSGNRQLTTWAFAVKNPQAAGRRFFLTDSVYLANGSPSHVFDLNGEPHLCVNYWRSPRPARPLQAGKIIHRWDWREAALARVDEVPDVDASITSFDECSVVQCPDRSLLAIFRTTAGLYSARKPAGSSVWSAPSAFTALGNTTPARSSMRVTPAGRIVLVFNNAADRTNMTIALSEDGGLTWPYTFMFDDRANIAYPSIDFTGGDILVTYDRSRETLAEIVLARISEAAVVAGTATVDRRVVSAK